jgi:hypothetical protein
MTQETVESIVVTFDKAYPATIYVNTYLIPQISREEVNRLNTALWNYTWELEKALIDATNERNSQYWNIYLRHEKHDFEDKEFFEHLKDDLTKIIKDAAPSRSIKFKVEFKGLDI